MTVKEKINIEEYIHDNMRKNNPLIGLVTSVTDRLNGRTQYQHDPHIDPYLSWAGKVEKETLEIQNVSLHIHERIDPARIIKSFLKSKPEEQLSFFDRPENEPPLTKAIEFYKHDQLWANRLIAGDSKLIMNSLLVKEGMAGKVQMIYFDPPYCIKYNSNFQPFVNKRDVVNGSDSDIPAEPEMIQAFRDTWELEMHSYLTYIQTRLLLAKSLLHETGSIFIQISDENIHIIRIICDEVFGKENFISQISFQTTNSVKKTLNRSGDYLIWYAKNHVKIKYNQLYIEKDFYDGSYNKIEILNGDKRNLTQEEKNNLKKIPMGSKIYSLADLTSKGASSQPQPFEYIGRIYYPTQGKHWAANYPEGMELLKKSNRIEISGNTLRYIRYFNDFPVQELNNNWTEQLSEQNKIYVVQTAEKTVQRCLIMTTDPGDLVLDITCGSGTTAYVAEKWGRRWITCDTSRVALTLAKQRLMTSKFDYYDLAYPEQGLKSGFKYKTVPHITLGSIANNEPPRQETLYDQPFIDKKRIRVTGPFTVEAVPSLRVKPFDGNMPKMELDGVQLTRTEENSNRSEWCDELKACGIRGIKGNIIHFDLITPMQATHFLHARGEIQEKNGTRKLAYISFGPDYAPLEKRQIESAIQEIKILNKKPDLLVFAAFQFDPEASKDIDYRKQEEFTIIKTQMSVDLLTADFRKKRSSNQSYWLIGQPDVEISKDKQGHFIVKLTKCDYYDPITGTIEEFDTNHVAMWFLDTDYDDRCIIPDQVFFPMSTDKHNWTKLAKTLKAEIDENVIEKFSGIISLPFTIGDNKKIAVKIIDNRGIESFVIKELV